MEIVLALAGVALGGSCSWFFTRFYYLRGDREQKALFNKLSEEVRSAILEDSREKLTVPELNDLLREKVFDPLSGDPLPYLVCPECGSDELKRSSARDAHRGDVLYVIECQKCKWSEALE